ncbi:hypothetical protein S7335_5558 [Synechococcus sp. PCC 7335]|nr:hypothetical protein S7335_5558 [Synechococcus sp. PCC 7335]
MGGNIRTDICSNDTTARSATKQQAVQEARQELLCRYGHFLARGDRSIEKKKAGKEKAAIEYVIDISVSFQEVSTYR